MNDRVPVKTARHNSGEIFISIQSIIDLYSRAYEIEENPLMKEFWKNQIMYWKNQSIISKGEHILDEVFKK